MAYAVTADVSSDLKRLTAFGASTVPTTTEVTAYLDEISSDMDAKMQAVGIIVPVTDSGKLKVLKTICVNGAAARVFRVLNGEAEAAMVRQGLYDDAMARIMKNPGIIASAQSSASAPSGSTAQETRPFSRDSKDW
jgi:glyceraldehyde-3-phosphate dehydrogenase/erythrose-4-phosphate dehydrogenase